MTLNFKTDKKELVKDYRSFLFRSLFQKDKLIILSIFIIGLIIKLNSVKDSTFDLISVVMLFGTGGLLIIEMFFFIKNSLSISKFANESENRSGTVHFANGKIEFNINNYLIVVFNSELKRVARYGDTVFVEVKNSKYLPHRLNKIELGEGGFNIVLEHFKINPPI